AVLPVVQHGVTLYEGAASAVLPCHADGGALEQQRTERQQLAEAPVDGAIAAHVDPLLQQLLKLRMHGETSRRVVVRITDCRDHALGHTGGLWLSRCVILL